MTTIIRSVKEWQQIRNQNSFHSKTVGFVPTMGNLHQGHQSLLKRSVNENQITVLSIFVNPTQFNNPDDLAKYPRTFAADVAIATHEKVDFILAPEYSDLYPDHYKYQVRETEFSQELCGKNRPGHFDGVLTIVLKLFNLVRPTKAYFGEKDFQQLQLIKNMVSAFFLDIDVVACPTMRDAHGLALSSRNNRLTPEQYQHALNFPKLLSAKKSCAEIKQELIHLGFKVDYIEEHQNRRFGAIHVGEVRLIDNIEIG